MATIRGTLDRRPARRSERHPRRGHILHSELRVSYTPLDPTSGARACGDEPLSATSRVTMKVHLPLAIVLGLAACSWHATTPRSSTDRGGKTDGEQGARTGSAYAVPTDVNCTSAPEAQRQPWNRPVESRVIASGTPHHR